MGLDAATKNDDDGAILYERWAEKFGDIFSVPSALGSEKVVIMDPKTLINYSPKETRMYQQPAGLRATLKDLVRKLLHIQMVVNDMIL